jgi:hypothetical protein
VPVRSTYRIPRNAVRSSTHGRPPLALTGCVGSKGAISAHNASLSSTRLRLAMPTFYPVVLETLR